MPSNDIITIEGVVEEALANALFRIKLDSGQDVLGHLSGKMRMHYIRVVAGDRVKIELTPYDLTKGRIVARLNIGKK